MARRSINKGIRVERKAGIVSVKIGWPVILFVLGLIIWACSAA